MRIIHSLEGTSWSGGQQQAFFLAERQKKMGHDVLVLCQKNGVLQERSIAAGINVLPVDYRKELNPFSILQLLKAYDQFKPDIVNVHRAWAHTQWLLVALLRRFHGLVVSRRVLFRPDRNPASLIKYRSKAVRGFIAVSESVKKMLMDVGVAENRIKVVFSATDTDVFSPEVEHGLLEPIAGLTENARCILMVGNYHQNKGHEVLLKAFAEIGENFPELHLVIAGKETSCEKLESMVRSFSCGNRIHLLGFRKDVAALMQRSLFTVNASFKEGFSGTIRESLMMGKPVIASEIPANLEIHQKIPLLLFPPGDVSCLAKQISVLCKKQLDADAARKLHLLAASFFSVEKMVEDTVCAYKSFLKI